SIEPRDELEAMLAAQMAAVHQAAMAFASRLVQTDNVQARESAERAVNKLTRTFATQMEALKRYRGPSEQRVAVHHHHHHHNQQNVTVEDGGQAVVALGTPGASPGAPA